MGLKHHLCPVCVFLESDVTIDSGPRLGVFVVWPFTFITRIVVRCYDKFSMRTNRRRWYLSCHEAKRVPQQGRTYRNPKPPPPLAPYLSVSSVPTDSLRELFAFSDRCVLVLFVGGIFLAVIVGFNRRLADIGWDSSCSYGQRSPRSHLCRKRRNRMPLEEIGPNSPSYLNAAFD